ncbi:uncharacterized protein LOC118429776 [Branchiostoma floridae]|uniref:Uncharacterized protein LOC118429776 n=1 Tax=Branchiostoma floridae TaxID=7739 RepID=A0A9J7N7Q4_BRAFL|nr:uncharacterized protein LOC118429776 [Branchiostoma floridae]
MLEENRILVYNKDKEVVLWKNGIRSPVNITSVFFARAVLPIESKEAKLEKERACLPYKSPKKLQAFFQEYRSTSLPLGSNGDIFAPREGGSSDMERFRVWECGFEYVNPPEKLIVIGHFQGDAAVMVGTKSGKVYLDKDEIVYNVADTLSDFADKGCRKNPTFFDFCLARPKDVNSLPCAAGTYKDEKLAEDIPEEDRWTFIGHDPKELETDREKARRLYAERADYFKHPPEDFLDFSNEENQSQSESFFAQFDPNEVNQEPFWSWPCQDIPTSNPFNQHAFQLCVET